MSVRSRQMLTQYLDACRQISVDPRHALTPQKLICLNLRSTDQRALYDTVFKNVDDGDLYVDWKQVPGVHKYVIDSAFWIYFLSRYFVVSAPGNADNVVGVQSPLLRSLLSHMDSVNLSSGWETTVRTLLLMNIDRTQGLHTIDLFLGEKLKRKVYNNCMQLLSAMADTRYTPQEYASTMQWVLRECLSLQQETLVADLEWMQKSAEDGKQALVLRNMMTSHGRLRLRDRLAGSRKQRGACMQGDTLQGFQTAVNFSSNISLNTQLKAYMIMAQTCVDKKQVLHALLPVEVCKQVERFNIIDPDFETVRGVIQRVQYTRAPFDALREFHLQCFSSIAFSQKNTLTLTHIMQLYLCAFQHSKIWQKCWTSVLPVMNAQLVRDVQAFVDKQENMDVEAFIYALKNMQ